MVATYLHGPVLVRNPALADLLLTRAAGPLPAYQDAGVELLRTELRAAKVNNVEPVLSGDDTTGLRAASVDLALMVDVYHELAEPVAFMRDLRRALAPGGRVVLVEFRGEDPEVPIREEHKLTVAQADAELRAHGFERVARHDFLPWQHILVYRPRP